MTKNPLVSILMPAYNAEKFISESIESIVNQDCPNWELLVLDDASTDSTLQIIQAFQDERIRVFQHQENLGYLLSCNELFEKTEGDFITFLDADDTCKPNRISSCLSAFESDTELYFLTTDHIRTDESGKTISEHRIKIDYGRYASEPTYNPTICCATIFVKTELVQQTQGYRRLFRGVGGEDYFWLWELSKLGKGTHLSQNLYSYRSHANQLSKGHKDEIYLFVPELLERVKERFSKKAFGESEAEKIKSELRSEILAQPSLINLRKAQMAVNNGESASAFKMGFRALLKSNPKNVSEILKLLFYVIPVRWLR